MLPTVNNMDLTVSHNKCVVLGRRYVFFRGIYMLRYKYAKGNVINNILFSSVNCKSAQKSHAKIITPVPDRFSLGHN